MIGLPAWGAKQGYGSFLTFELGQPRLGVTERHSSEKGLRRSAIVRGQWHLWIYCCHWRALQDGTELAWSENTDQMIGQAAAALDAQKLLAVEVAPGEGRSTFTFDLGGSLETWPYGDDPTHKQWIILTESESFAYRADGLYSCGPGNTHPDLVNWRPFG